MGLTWGVRFGEYYALVEPAGVYIVTKVRLAGDLYWTARYNDDNGNGSWITVPGPFPLNRRQAMKNAEDHAEEALRARQS